MQTHRPLRLLFSALAAWMLARGAVAQPQYLVHLAPGPQPNDGFGESLVAVGDVNGDGIREVLTGSHNVARNGAQNGAQSGGVALLDGATCVPLWSDFGSGAGDWYGLSVANAGDVNRDGIDDFLIGAPASATSGGSGYVRVVSGAPPHALLVRIPAPTPGDEFGYSVAGGFDWDRDGDIEVVIGAPAAGRSPGLAHGFEITFDRSRSVWTYQPSGLWGFQSTTRDMFGFVVRNLSDVNGDGVAELGITAFANGSLAGQAYVYSRTGLLYRWTGAANEWLGVDMSRAGDVDADGHADVAVGATNGNTQLGQVRVFSGRTGVQIGAVLTSGQPDYFGRFLGDAKDFDGDRRPDLLISALGYPSWSVRTGQARVYSFLGGQWTLKQSWTGTAPDDNFGYAMTFCGDVN